MRQRKKTNEIHEVQIIKTGNEVIKRPRDISTLIEEFLSSLDILPISKETYRTGILKFLTWQKSNNISNPTREDLLTFKNYLGESSLSVNTCNSCLTATKRFFSYLKRRYGYDDITEDVKGFKQPRGHLRDAFTAEQVEELGNNIDISTIQGKRNFAILSLLADTSIRTVSIRLATREDLRIKGKEAVLSYQGKGSQSKDKKAILTESSLPYLLAYLKARGKVALEDPLFVSHSDRNNGQRLTTRTIRGFIKGSLRQMGIDDPRLSAHSLRHFALTNALKNGADLLNVSSMAGHASVTTTQIYLHELDRRGPKAAERFIKYKKRELTW